MSDFVSKIRFVLVRTTHPGNIGATARAMKNMGLDQLYLVSPKIFPHSKATARASGAQSVLANAVVVETLAEALVGCSLVVATSARLRALPWPTLDARECAEKIIEYVKIGEVAVVFGQERSGLSNEELAECHYHLQIPTAPDFGSLNLAQAVQVVAYELQMATRKSGVYPLKPDKQLATADEMFLFYQHLEKVLIQLKFLNPDSPKQLMHRLKRLFNRAQIESLEMNILRGILTAVEKNVGK